MRPRVLDLRGRIVLLVLIVLLPMLVLFIAHTRQERGWLLEEAQNRALLIARLEPAQPRICRRGQRAVSWITLRRRLSARSR
jgi:hypothetical protein